MLIDHGGGVWTAASEIRLPGFWLPLRMTVVALEGGLWVHSPIAFDPALADGVAALGPVRWLVGPNLLHHRSLGAWAAHFGDAELWGAAGLAAKRPELPFTGTLGTGAQSWPHALESIAIEGSPKIGETVFLHRPSATLIVTDLLFNVLVMRGLATPWVLRLMGTHRRLAQSRAWRFGITDRVAFARSGQRLLDLAPERLIVAHGEVIERLQPGALEHALSWMCATPGGDSLR